MLTFTNIRNVKNGMYDKVYAPVRSLKNPSPWMEQVADLSPSPALLGTYLRLKKEGNWNKNTFQSIYVPQFLTEIRHNKKACQWLNFLYNEDKAGRNIALVCFCADETLCHRSILAGMLKAVGANVRTDGMVPFAGYYDMFRQIA